MRLKLDVIYLAEWSECCVKFELIPTKFTNFLICTSKPFLETRLMYKTCGVTHKLCKYQRFTLITINVSAHNSLYPLQAMIIVRLGVDVAMLIVLTYLNCRYSGRAR